MLDSALGHIEDLRNRYYRLMLLFNVSSKQIAALADQLQCPLINLNLVVSEQLKAMPSKDWSRELSDIVRDILSETNSDTVVIDRIEVLFEPALQRDPLKLLQDCSRNRTIIVHWPGEMHNEHLVYAVPGHPEYRQYADVDAVVIDGP